MAFMNQEHKKELAPAIKLVLKKYGMKGSIAVEHYSSLVVNIREGKLDLIENWIENHAYDRVQNTSEQIDTRTAEDRATAHIQVNPYNIDSSFSGDCEKFLSELRVAMMTGNHNNSDVMSDYFDVGWYININIGRWNKPYKFVA